MDKEESDGSAASAVSYTVVSNPDGSDKTVYVAPIPSSRSKAKKPSKKQQEESQKDQPIEKEKTKSKATVGRKSTPISVQPEQSAHGTQKSGAGSGGSASTAPSQPVPTVSLNDVCTIVQEVVGAMQLNVLDVLR